MRVCLFLALRAAQASPSKAGSSVGTNNLYFSAPRPPKPGNILYLNGEDTGIVNNMCLPSEVRACVCVYVFLHACAVLM